MEKRRRVDETTAPAHSPRLSALGDCGERSGKPGGRREFRRPNDFFCYSVLTFFFSAVLQIDPTLVQVSTARSTSTLESRTENDFRRPLSFVAGKERNSGHVML